MTAVAGRPLRTALVDAERRLAAAGVPEARTDAELMLAEVLGVTRTRLVLSDDIDRSDLGRFEVMVARRCSRIPLQHIVGHAPFRYRTVAVGRGVFVPRPETEVVTEAAVRALLASAGKVAVDLCSGSGAVALAVATEVPGSTVYAVEVDPVAADWLQRNVDSAAAELVVAGSTVHVISADAGKVHDEALAYLQRQVDVVVCNPPYIPSGAVPRDLEVREHDPAIALYGGPDGLDVVRAVAVAAAALLHPGGALVIEHGDAQGESGGEAGVPEVLRLSGHWRAIIDRVDLTGRDRFTLAERV